MSLYTRIIDLQKLRAAWQKVRKGKPAAGVDNITTEQFDAQADQNLKELKAQLENHTYETQPVRIVTIYREEKARDIALYCMRDKVVQQSIASELTRMYENTFSRCTYAYVSSRSALSAVEDISRQLQTGKYPFLLKLDITHFFDEIDWKTLRADLQKRIAEEDVLQLIQMNCCGDYLKENTRDLFPKSKGIYQGSGLSPVLSNIYLQDFDRWLETLAPFYVRYADDMLILGQSKDQLTSLLAEISLKLQELHLRLNEDKTCCVAASQGVEFLGYHFDQSGKSIPAKAQLNLHTRLETMWLTSAALPLEDKLKKAGEITGGWEQYYREKREIASILEFASMVYTAGDDEKRVAELASVRPKLVNEYQDLMKYLSAFWTVHGFPSLELLEYEQYYQVPGCGGEDGKTDSTELRKVYRQYIVTETADLAVELMQIYTDRKQYQAASFWMHQKESLEQKRAAEGRRSQMSAAVATGDHEADPLFDEKTPDKFLQIFAGRTDLYSKESMDGSRGRQNITQTQPLTGALVREHLRGNLTLGTFIQRPNATVHFIVFDVDISRRVLLQLRGQDQGQLQAYLNAAYGRAQEINKILDQMGMRGYIEFSGSRGYHVWLLLTEWITVKYANMFCDIIEAKLHQDENEDITVEYFPNRVRLKPGKFGQTVKLPYGIHPSSGRRSCFLDDDGRPVQEINPYIDSMARFSSGAIRKVLARNSGQSENVAKKEVDTDISAYENADATVQEVLRNCSLMRYLCLKSVKTGYLTHFERLTVLYVFGHLGEPGRKFVHDVMSHTLNYSYNVTEKFIRKCPDRPISCTKLQDQYKQLTAEIGCNCVFRMKKNCYPSPVLHAILMSPEMKSDITIPLSRTISAEKKQQVLDDMNIHTKALTLAKQILDYKKQKRGLDRNIRDIEKQLSEIFDNAQIEQLETDLGVLTRRKQGNSYEFVIEL